MAFSAGHQARDVRPSNSAAHDARVAAGIVATPDAIPGAASTLTTEKPKLAERVVHASGLLDSSVGRNQLRSHVSNRAVRLVVSEDTAQAPFLLEAILPAQTSVSATLGTLIDTAPPGFRCKAARSRPPYMPRGVYIWARRWVRPLLRRP